MESSLVIFLSLWIPLLKTWPVILLALLSFFSINLFSKHKKSFSSLNWPILGRLPSILKNAHCVNEVLLDTFNIFGASFKFKGPVFTGMNYLITCHPRNIEYILKNNFSNFPKGLEFKDIFDIFGDGIFTTDHDPWVQLRKTTHGRFISKEFRNFVAKVNRSEIEASLHPLLVHLSKEESTFDIQSVFVRLTFDASMHMIFGSSSKYLSAGFPCNELAEAIEVATETMFYRHVVPSLWWKFMRLLRVGQERENAKARRTIDHEIGELISQKKKELMLLGFGPDKGLLSTYMNDQYSSQVGEKSTSDHKFLRDTALIILFASADTTASGLTWFFWCICNNPRVESNILEELRNVVSKKKNSGFNGTDDHFLKQNRLSSSYVFDPEDLKDLVYMHAALMESLRLYPPGYLNHKSVVENDVLPDGVRVRKGMKAILSIYAVARMEWIWGKDCKEFRPERWIDEEGKFKTELLSKFFTFNVGPRTCLGKEMAFNLMKSAIAAILYNFHVELVEAQPDCLKQSIVLLMKNGLNVKVRERLA